MKRARKTESTENVLILGAFLPEIQPVKRALGKWRGATFGLTGIGLINATLATAKLIQQSQPRHIIFIGSVGAASPKTKLLSVIHADSVSLVDPCELLGKTEILSAGQPVLRADRSWKRIIRSSSSEITGAGVYTTVGLTRSKSLARKIAQDARTQFESLELYGVAAACNAAGIPWNSIQVVTNHLGPNGHIEWKRNFRRAADITAKILIQLL